MSWIEGEERGQLEKRVLYAARKGIYYMGVYSSAEQAKQADIDGELEIHQIEIEGKDAACAQYVCMAEGTWTSLRMSGGNCVTENCLVKPAWGFTVQDCLFALSHNELNYVVSLKSLYICKIDRTYRVPLNAAKQFQTLYRECARQMLLPQQMRDIDYIQEYFAQTRREVEYIEKYYSVHTKKLLQNINEVYPLKIEEKNWTRSALCRTLTIEEMERASILDSQSIADETTEKEKLPDEIQALCAKVRGCILYTRHARRRPVKLKDFLE